MQRSLFPAGAGLIIGLMFSTGAATPAHRAGALAPPSITGLDHVPVAVGDLEAAAARYRALGFALKPGTPHDNGIRNQHVKFTDGTELELITAPAARDPLTTTYRRHLALGDGPAFAAFYAPAMDRVASELDRAGRHYTRDHDFLEFPEGDPLHYFFFGPRNRSPTDRPEHFAHPNTAQALVAIWLAADDLSEEREMLQTLGATISRTDAHVPDSTAADLATLAQGQVLLLPGSRQVVRGRRVVGATIRVASLVTARRVLTTGGWPTLRTWSGVDSTSVFLPPAITHGLWIELRQMRAATASGDPAWR